MSQQDPPPGTETATPDSHAPAIRNRKDLYRLSLAALGVVYGDIGTSPLYAIRECFLPPHGVEVVAGNVLGILSLVFWSLSLVVVFKYLVVVMRADNRGDGGIMALLTLVISSTRRPPRGEKGYRRWGVLVSLGLFGASLLFAEGMITPAISVLSAVEGLEVATPLFRPAVVPITVLILLGLFLVQRRGTAAVGRVFGPLMTIWFLVIAALGLPAILRRPEVLAALDPRWAFAFFVDNGLHGFLILGAVVLCFTGTEALYADMGHFGARPIRFAWTRLVFPALLLNYFGQGALVLERGAEVVRNPFYSLAPPVLLYPTVAIATAAAVIASQALISGAFSLVQQAIQLGYSPRLTIVHTSAEARGQIYVPEINSILMLACIALVLAFRESTNLAAAYGIAVLGTMVITSLLVYAVTRQVWRWRLWQSLLLVGCFLAIEIPFLLANTNKLLHGGWVPLVVGIVFFTLMRVWKWGRRALSEQLEAGRLPIDLFLADAQRRKLHRVPGTAVIMTSLVDGTPPVLLHQVKHNKVLHEKVVLLTIRTEGMPRVPRIERVQVRELGAGFFQVIGRYGFMESPDVPSLLRWAERFGLQVGKDVSYFLGRETLLRSDKSKAPGWMIGLFSFLSRNARPATHFYHLPPNRVVELGAQVAI
ncbi:MAG: potassium transporter Kup [Thermoanaerobaculia bacterium]|nr:potassium transporter Kup [Thermoanaerobaculia bacterium]